ncbi:MAG: EI24 domain-containing protein [Rickettsiales bacterium]|nr:EI24 domain-containing protein [Rickettsiales bacterium]
MIATLFRSLLALKAPFFWKYTILSILITAITFGLFWSGMGYLLFSIEFEWSWVKWLFDALVSWLGPVVAFALSYFFFPLLMPLVSVLFLEGIVTRTEQHFYPSPESEATKPPSFWAILPATLRFVLVSLFLNILILPLYLVPVLNLFIYYILNGYLFGREYFELIALRYHQRKDAGSLRKQNRRRIWLAGLIITLAYTTPFLNLIAPIVSAIFIVHVYHHILALKPH